MRLLDVESLEVVEADDVTPPYAILSHRWENEEVSFTDLNAPVQDAVLNKRGYRKIKDACEYTRRQCGLRYIWIDTCCIDKSSSAELSEAINSMYRWYEESVVCFAFLSDVSTVDDIAEEEPEISKSKWFTRGWTLQELLAPSKIVFLSSSWVELGTRAELSPTLSKITSIAEPYLNGEEPLASASLACRMSWASQRTTKRPEDRAYCLLGIFDVNMPLLYGEGLTKAFRRLQEEILQDTTDESIFAWWQEGEHVEGPCGFLAKTPADFAHSADIIPWRHPDTGSFELTRRAIGLRGLLSRYYGEGGTTVVLQCRHSLDPANSLSIGCVETSEDNHVLRAHARKPGVVLSRTSTPRDRVFAMKQQQPQEQSREFDIILGEISKAVKFGQPVGDNFIWDPKGRTIRRIDPTEPFKVRVPVHIKGVETEIGLWLLADGGPSRNFSLDQAALLPPWESLEFRERDYRSSSKSMWHVSELSYFAQELRSKKFHKEDSRTREAPFLSSITQEKPCSILNRAVGWDSKFGGHCIVSVVFDESAAAEFNSFLINLRSRSCEVDQERPPERRQERRQVTPEKDTEIKKKKKWWIIKGRGDTEKE